MFLFSVIDGNLQYIADRWTCNATVKQKRVSSYDLFNNLNAHLYKQLALEENIDFFGCQDNLLISIIRTKCICLLEDFPRNNYGFYGIRS